MSDINPVPSFAPLAAAETIAAKLDAGLGRIEAEITGKATTAEAAAAASATVAAVHMSVSSVATADVSTVAGAASALTAAVGHSIASGARKTGSGVSGAIASVFHLIVRERVLIAVLAQAAFAYFR